MNDVETEFREWLDIPEAIQVARDIRYATQVAANKAIYRQQRRRALIVLAVTVATLTFWAGVGIAIWAVVR